MSSEQKRLAKKHFASEDWEDLLSSEMTISFTEVPRSSNSRGGRHVEFGAAYALGQRCLIVGPVENVFHLLDRVHRFETFEDLLDRWEYAICTMTEEEQQKAMDELLAEAHDLDTEDFH